MTKKKTAPHPSSVFTTTPVRLVYVRGTEEGIKRVRIKDGFEYFYRDEKITDEDVLKRIRQLAIPPAWEDVWICRKPNGHLQAYGKDAKNRKQYRYHAEWAKRRNETKFDRMAEFGHVLPLLRSRIEKDLSLPTFCRNKVIAMAISVMEQTSIRIGNSVYEKENGSFGLTTLKNNHIRIAGTTVNFSFVGKKGIRHKVSLRSIRLSRLIRQCRDLPGKELFQYRDEDGNYQAIDSGMVNDYIREATGKEFTAKDFRTWNGSVNALRALYQSGPAENAGEVKRKILEMLDYVAVRLGNTRTVCKKYYVHPQIIKLYEDDALQPYLEELSRKQGRMNGLTCEEKVLLSLLSGKRIRHRKVA